MPKKLECPFCQSTMIVDQFYGNEIERCPKCKEIWFDNNELKKVIQNMGYDASEFIKKFQLLQRDNQKSINCPACKKQLLGFYDWKGTNFGFCDNCKGIIMAHSKINAVNKTLKSSKKSEDIDWVDAILNGLILNLDKLIK